MANCKSMAAVVLATSGRRRGTSAAALTALLALLSGASAASDPAASNQEDDSPAVRFATRAARTYQEAKEKLRAAPVDPVAGWQFARACFDLAEYATNDSQRAAVAREGIAVSRELLKRQPSSAPANYYLGMNLGQLARTRSLGALAIVEEMERTFKVARDLDESFDYFGPDRCLGLLYRDAPGWPLSVGNRRKARTHLEKAVAGAPDYPENRLNLLEACLRWNDPTGARREWQALSMLLPKARAQLQGEQWDVSWADWDRRAQTIRTRMEHESDR